MINVMKMKLFPMFSRMISIPTNEEKPYNVIFMSENSNFTETYSKLNIRRQFVKRVTYFSSRNPRVISNMKLLLPYKQLGLIPVIRPDISNIYVDTDPFFVALDTKYGKQSYKRPIVFQKVVSYLNMVKGFSDAKNILMYHVSLDKPVNVQFLYRRSVVLALMAQVGDGTLPFDNVILAIEQGGIIKFTSIFNKEQEPIKYPRIISILKRLIPKGEEVEGGAEITKTESINVSPEQKEKESILRFIEKHQKQKVLTS